VFSKLGNPGKWWVVEKKLVLTTTTHDFRGATILKENSLLKKIVDCIEKSE
jgi:hypothetical protein